MFLYVWLVGRGLCEVRLVIKAGGMGGGGGGVGAEINESFSSSSFEEKNTHPVVYCRTVQGKGTVLECGHRSLAGLSSQRSLGENENSRSDSRPLIVRCVVEGSRLQRVGGQLKGGWLYGGTRVAYARFAYCFLWNLPLPPSTKVNVSLWGVSPI